MPSRLNVLNKNTTIRIPHKFNKIHERAFELENNNFFLSIPRILQALYIYRVSIIKTEQK
jgi:hypothetical protein